MFAIRCCALWPTSLAHLPRAPFFFSRYGRLDHRRLDHHVDRIHTLCVSLPRCSASVPGPIRPPTCNASDRGQGIFAHLLILLNSTVMRQLSQFLNPGASLPEFWSPPSFAGPGFHRLPVRTAVVPSYCTPPRPPPTPSPRAAMQVSPARAARPRSSYFTPRATIVERTEVWRTWRTWPAHAVKM